MCKDDWDSAEAVERRQQARRDHAQRVYDWIMARLDEGMTVYAMRYGHGTRLKSADREFVRVRNDHVEVRAGKGWNSIIGSKFTARAE